MSINYEPGVVIDTAALEAALPTLTTKLQSLESSLTDNEKLIFSSIVNSAAYHLEQVQTVYGGSTADVAYMKPISVVATQMVRQQIIDMPGTLGLS